MFSIKRSLIGCAVFTLVATSSQLLYAYHSNHVWVKISEQQGSGSTKVCQWQCNVSPLDSHVTTTSGYGTCPRPSM